MLKIFESYWREKKLKIKVEQLEQENWELHNTVSALLKEVERRDQTISMMQLKQASIKPVDPFAFDFPGTEKSFDDFWANFTSSKNKES